MTTTTKSRLELEQLFLKNSIPKEVDFASLIHGALNQVDDGICKNVAQPLTVFSDQNSNAEQDVLRLTQGDHTTDWTFSLQPREVAGDPATTKSGLAIAPTGGERALFIEDQTGAVGLGTIAPEAALHVKMREHGGSALNGLCVTGSLDAADANELVGMRTSMSVSGLPVDSENADVVGAFIDLTSGDQPRASGVRSHIRGEGKLTGVDCFIEDSAQCTGMNVAIAGASEVDGNIAGGLFSVEQAGGYGSLNGLDIELLGRSSLPVPSHQSRVDHHGVRIRCEAAPGNVRTRGLEVKVECENEHSGEYTVGGLFLSRVRNDEGSNPRSEAPGYFIGAQALAEYKFGHTDEHYVCGLFAQAKGTLENRIGIYSSIFGDDVDFTPNLPGGIWAGWFNGNVKANMVRAEAYHTTETHPRTEIPNSRLNLRAPLCSEGLVFVTGSVDIDEPFGTSSFRAFFGMPDYAERLIGDVEPSIFVTPNERVAVSAEWFSSSKAFALLADEQCTVNYFIVARRDDDVRSERPVEELRLADNDWRQTFVDGSTAVSITPYQDPPF